MPIHDWTRVSHGLFHHFHQCWIGNLSDVLNGGLIPPCYFALIERTVSDESYISKANHLAIRHESGEVVAVIELLSPGNKDSRNALRAFVEKALRLLNEGIHLLIVDLFPPTARDPQGIHKVIWDQIQEEPFELPSDKPLILAAYVGGEEGKAYVEPVAVGDTLPDMPLFLEPGRYVPVPLEMTYQTTWDVYPATIKPALEVPSH